MSPGERAFPGLTPLPARPSPVCRLARGARVGPAALGGDTPVSAQPAEPNLRSTVS